MARRKRRKFTEQFKADAVRLVTSGSKSFAEVTAQFDLTETSLRAWVTLRERQPLDRPALEPAPQTRTVALDVQPRGRVLDLDDVPHHAERGVAEGHDQLGRSDAQLVTKPTEVACERLRDDLTLVGMLREDGDLAEMLAAGQYITRYEACLTRLVGRSRLRS